jgi:hypothetical protein
MGNEEIRQITVPGLSEIEASSRRSLGHGTYLYMIVRCVQSC